MALSPIRVFVADDHRLVRESIRRILADISDMTFCGEASTGEETIQKISEVNPDVVLMDLRMPYINGEDAVFALLQKHPELKVLVVSICFDDIILQKLFRKGVRGYLSKTSSGAEMLKAIRIVGQGDHYVNAGLTQNMFNNPKKDKLVNLSFDYLSERELQVVLMIIDGGLMHEMSKKLGVDRKTINSYRTRAFQKLGIRNDVELTLLAFRQGLLKDFMHG